MTMNVDRVFVPSPDGAVAPPGPLERRTREDIAAMGSLSGGARATQAELAYLLAATIDRASLDPDTSPSVIGNLAKVLITALREVTRTADDSSRRDTLTSWLATAMGNAPHPGPADAGPQGGHVGPDARPAVHAAPGSSIMDVALEIDPETGKLAYNDITIVIGRQQGKTTLVLPKILHRALGFGRTPQRILYTAQTADKAKEKWRDLYVAEIMRSPLAEMVAKGSPRLRLNAERLEFTTGSTFVPVTPNAKTGGTGDTVDEGHIDEAWSFEDSGVEQAMSPAMVTRDQPQLWVESTAKRQPKGSPKNTRFAGYLRSRIAAGRARVEAGIIHDTAYFEWSAPLDMDPQDPRTWWACLPAMGDLNRGFTTTEAAMKAQLARMDLADFCAEFLGWWPSDAALRWQIVAETQWRRLASRGVKPGYPIAFSVDTNPDREMSAIVAAGPAGLPPSAHGETSDRWAVEVVEYRTGSAWVVPRLVELCDRWRPCGISVPANGAAASTIPLLEAAGLPVKPMHGPDMAKAYGMFMQATTDDESLRHPAQPELDTAMSLAWSRKVGAQTLFDWNSPGDVSPAVAAAGALWAAQIFGPEFKSLDYDVLRSVY